MVTIGTIIYEPGTSFNNKTGSWRVFKPIMDKDKCVMCENCFIFCPEGCIKEKDGKFENASWDEALDKAAEILANAKRPLFFIGSETSTEAMRVGLHMAEYLRGVADSNATI